MFKCYSMQALPTLSVCSSVAWQQEDRVHLLIVGEPGVKADDSLLTEAYGYL